MDNPFDDPPQKVVNPFDNVVNPFDSGGQTAPAVSATSQQQDNSPGWKQLLTSDYPYNLGKFLVNSFANDQERKIQEAQQGNFSGPAKRTTAALSQFADNALNTAGNLINKGKDLLTGKTSIGDVGSAIGGGIATGMKELPSQIPNMPNMLAKQFVETPLSAISGQKMDPATGNASAMTPQEQAQAMQETAGSAAMLAATSGASSAIGATGIMAPTLAKGVMPLGVLPKMGNLGKAMISGVTSGVVGGAAQGAIANLGDPDYINKTVAQTLASAPLGVLMELSHSTLNNAKEVGIKRTSSAVAANEIASINALRVTQGGTSLADVLAKTDALTSSDDYLAAAARSKLTVGQPFLVEGLPLDQIKASLDKDPNGPKYMVHEGAGGVHLVVPADKMLSPKHSAYFKETGFVPNQVVIHAGEGIPYAVQNANIETAPIPKLIKGKQAIVYHGTDANFETFDVTKADPNGLYGPGIYTTENPDIAAGYAGNSDRVDATHIDLLAEQHHLTNLQSELAKLNKPILDAQGNPTLGTAGDVFPDHKANLEKLISGAQSRIDDMSSAGPNIKRHIITLNNAFDIDGLVGEGNLSESHIQTLLDAYSARGYNPSYTEAWKFIEHLDDDSGVRGQNATGANVYSHLLADVSEKGDLNEILKTAGYDGIKHTGGRITGNDPHQVWIAFDPIQLSLPYEYLQQQADAGKSMVTLRNMADGTTKSVPLETVRRQQNTSLTYSEVLGKRGKGFIPGEATPVTVAKKLYEDFRDNFDPKRSFEQQFLDHLSSNGLDRMDAPKYEEAFYKQMHDDVYSQMTPAGKEFNNAMTSGLEKYNAEQVADNAWKIHSAVSTAGMYMEPNGNGNYALRDSANGRLLQTVASPMEALTFANKGQQGPMWQLDGGGSGPIPTAASRGVPVQPPASNISSTLLDKWQSSGWGIHFTPMLDVALAMQRRLKEAGVDNSVYDAAHDMQRAFEGYKYHMNYTFSKAMDILDTSKKISNALGYLDKPRRSLISDAIETRSPAEIIDQKIFTDANGVVQQTKMNGAELQMASQLAKMTPDIKAVSEYIHQISIEAGTKEMGSVEQMQAAAHLKKEILAKAALPGGTQSVSGGVIDAAELLLRASHGQDAVDFSPHAILTLADAQANSSMTRTDFYNRHQFSPIERQLTESLAKSRDQAFHSGGYSPAQQLGTSLPSRDLAIKLGITDYAGIPDQFTKALMGNHVQHGLERDPFVLGGSYIRQLAKFTDQRNPFSGQSEDSFYGRIKTAQKNIATDLGNISKLDPINDPKFEGAKALVQGVKNYTDKLHDSVMGYSDIESPLAKSLDATYNKMGWVPSTSSLISIMHSSVLGLRSVYGIRDVWDFAKGTTALFGPDVARRAFAGAIDRPYAKALIDSGALPPSSVADMTLNDSPEMRGQSAASRWIMKSNDIGTTLNGQKFVYTHALAGIYKAVREDALSALSEYNKGNLTWDEVGKKLNLDVYSLEYQTQLQQWAAKDPQLAAGELGREAGRKVMSNFGNFNQPLSWNSTPGRVIGMFGSWAANQGSTYARIVSNTDRSNWVRQSARLTTVAAMDAGLLAAGGAVGLNMSNFIYNPFGLYAHISPLVSSITDTAKIMMNGYDAVMSGDDDKKEQASEKLKGLFPYDSDHIAHRWIPWSLAAQDFANGVKNHSVSQALGIRPQEP